MSEDKKKKTPIPWEAADPAIPEIKSMVNTVKPVNLSTLPAAAPDLVDKRNS